ncbi:MAG: phage holin family protein [Lachnospiraceae bacterium]|nr:phage holin family protein [Lachnospiraceae bacterium]
MEFTLEMVRNPFLQAVALAIVFDTIMGVLRAIKERMFNSCVGINGAIRKVGMVLSIVFLHIVDTIVIGINLIGFIPEELWIWMGMEAPLHIGLAEFFAILFIGYEIVSILKNMALAGLPVKGLWKMVRDVLSKYTTELPDEC